MERERKNGKGKGVVKGKRKKRGKEKINGK